MVQQHSLPGGASVPRRRRARGTRVAVHEAGQGSCSRDFAARSLPF